MSTGKVQETNTNSLASPSCSYTVINLQGTFTFPCQRESSTFGFTGSVGAVGLAGLKVFFTDHMFIQAEGRYVTTSNRDLKFFNGAMTTSLSGDYMAFDVGLGYRF